MNENSISFYLYETEEIICSSYSEDYEAYVSRLNPLRKIKGIIYNHNLKFDKRNIIYKFKLNPCRREE
jgi:hypothetical protein